MYSMEFDLDKESFDIDSEVTVSKMINEYSSDITTEKNYYDPYGYDLRVFDRRYGYDLGFIEVEVSNYEKLGGKKWEHSFLQRKVFVFDNESKTFTDQLKENAYETIYIKFNRDYGLDDCICCKITDIATFRKRSQEKTKKVYNNAVLRTDITNPHVIIGINNCIEYMEEFFLKQWWPQ